MKKIIPFILCISMLLSSCGNSGKIKPKETVYPSELITVEELSPYIGYMPVMSETRSRRVSDAIFVSEPLGNGDLVQIKLRQKNGLQSADEVKAYFDECLKMRPDAFSVSLKSPTYAFIAYPTLHYYTNGYHVEVTAGSGSDDLQKNLLINIANITLDKLLLLTGIDTAIPVNTPESTDTKAENTATDSNSTEKQ